jgi:ABC-type phosphate/phosphonate transport system substrate-binding protein
MQRRAFLGLCGVGLAGLLEAPAWARGPITKVAVKVGLTASLFPGLSDALLATAAKPFRSLLESATGVSGQVVQGGDPRALADGLKQDKVQLGVFQGVEFAWGRVFNPKLHPLVICVNQKRTVQAHLIVRSTSPFKAPIDLRSQTLAIPVDSKQHCHTFLERKCVPASSTVKKFFKEVKQSVDVEEALDDVFDGSAGAALVDGLAWAAYREDKPGCAAQLRVLLASDTFPCGIIACQEGRFPDKQVKQFREGLVGAKDTPRGKQLLRFLRLTGFETLPADYERLLTAVAKNYPPPAAK